MLEVVKSLLVHKSEGRTIATESRACSGRVLDHHPNLLADPQMCDIGFGKLAQPLTDEGSSLMHHGCRPRRWTAPYASS